MPPRTSAPPAGHARAVPLAPTCRPPPPRLPAQAGPRRPVPPEHARLATPTATRAQGAACPKYLLYQHGWPASTLARGVVVEEPADRFDGGGQMLGVLPQLEQLGGRRERGDLAAGLGRVVLIDAGQHQHRRAEGPHLVPGHTDGEARSPHRGGERLDLLAAQIAAAARELLTPLLPHGDKQLPVAVGDPDRLLQDGRDDSFRRQFEQLQDERAADAAAEHQEPADAQMIHHRQLVGRIAAPRVAGLQRAGRPALRWSIAIIWYCPAYAVSGLIAATSHSGTLESIPPGASASSGNPVPCTVYQILAPPRSTYGTPVSSPDSDSENQRTAGPSATTGIGVVPGRG